MSNLEAVLRWFLKQEQSFRSSLAKVERKKNKHPASCDEGDEQEIQACRRMIGIYGQNVREVRRQIKEREYERALEAGPWC